MSVPTCTIVEAAEMAALSATLGKLWWATVIGLLAMKFDLGLWEWRVRRFLRRRRLQRIRAARLLSDSQA